MSSDPRTIVAVVDDLFFGVQITDTAKRAGFTVKFAKDQPSLLKLAGEAPSLIILDLNSPAALEHIARLKGDAATQAVPLLGFISHVNVEMKRKAEEAGCDTVVPRSAFMQTLAGKLR
jgi:CheY-like chemotaxis protein